jgi:hypothetical protein
VKRAGSVKGQAVVLVSTLVVLAAFGLTGCVADNQPAGAPVNPTSGQVEAYGQCAPDRSNAPCVETTGEGFTWVAVDSTGAMVAVPMAACGDPPCVRAGDQYVMERD